MTMKNQIMFFEAQSFEGLDLAWYCRSDIPIKNTSIHIYEFECKESATCFDDETQAKMLDELSHQLSEKYPDAFKIIYSESSQFFCRELYPLIVEFETKLRQALYISRALYEGDKITVDTFQYQIGKEKKPIEALVFGEIYTAIFADTNLKSKLMQKYDKPLSKADLLKIIQDLEESTEWQKIMGKDYHYIEDHFLEIEDFRNDVMHNHLISYATYVKAQKVLKSANEELTQAIRDKLITNSSEYLNTVNIFDVISCILTAIQLTASRINKIANSDGFANFLKLFIDSDVFSNNPTQLTIPESIDQEDEDND